MLGRYELPTLLGTVATLGSVLTSLGGRGLLQSAMFLISVVGRPLVSVWSHRVSSMAHEYSALSKGEFLIENGRRTLCDFLPEWN